MAQTGLQSLGGNINAPASQYIGSYNSNVLNGGAKTLFNILQKAGVVTGSYNGRTDYGAVLKSLDSNPVQAQKVLDSIGLGSASQRQQFANKSFGPASGTTAASRANNPDQALANLGMSASQIANANAGGNVNAAPIGTATLNQAPRTLDTPVNSTQGSPNSGIQSVQRIGNDFYVIENGKQRKIELPEFQSLGINEKFVAPGTTVSLAQATTGTSSGADDPSNILGQVLDGMQAQGYTINPNAEITPERAAEFLAMAEKNISVFLPQAQKEIAPFYQNQLKVAREGFLSSLGYGKDEILRQEQELEKQYGQGVRNIGEVAAEQGFAQSGLRRRDERDLADETQNKIDTGRRTLAYNSANAGRDFAQLYGSAELPNVNIAQAPRAIAGQGQFNKSSGQNQLYQLSDSIYSNLTGSQQYAQRAQEQGRASELEQSYNQFNSVQQPRTIG